MKNNWEFVKKIEEMAPEDLRERIQKGMDFKIENEIKPIPYLGEVEQVIEYEFPELEARCPMTGVKDWYKIRIKFVPDQFIPELKSLKFYFFGYEELPISHEHIVAKIYKDFKAALKPKQCAMALYVAQRGGLNTSIWLGDMDLLNFERPIKEDNYAR